MMRCARESLRVGRAPVAQSLAQSLLAHPQSLQGRILVVEDQPTDLERVALADTWVTIDAVSTGEAAIERLKEQRFDCLVVDLHLGSMSGQDVIAQARERGFRNLIVVVTGSGDVERIVAVERSIGATIARKPFEPKQLLGVIAHALGNAAIRPSSVPLPTTLSAEAAAKLDVAKFVERLTA